MKEMAGVPTFKRLTRMVQLLRYGFVVTAGLFLAWHLVELGMGLNLDGEIVAELALVSVLGPLVAWFGGQRILGLVVEVEARSRELHALNRMSQEIFAESLETKENMDEMLEACQLCRKVTTAVGETTAQGSVPVDDVLDAVVTVMKMDLAELWVVGPTDPEVLQLVSQRGIALDAFRERTSFPVGEGFPGLAVQTRAPVVSNDAANDPRLVRKGLKLAGFTAFVAVPLLLKDGEVMGAVTAGTRFRGIGAPQVSHLQETMSNLAPLLRRLMPPGA